jgi:hypothetical protein
MMKTNVSAQLMAANDLPIEHQPNPQQSAKDKRPRAGARKKSRQTAEKISTGILGDGSPFLSQKKTQNESTSKMPLWLKFLIATLILSVITFAVIAFVFSMVAVPLIPIVFAGLANIHNALAFAGMVAGGVLVVGTMTSGIVALAKKEPNVVPPPPETAQPIVSPMRRLSAKTGSEADSDNDLDSPRQPAVGQIPLHQNAPDVACVMAQQAGLEQDGMAFGSA